RGENQRTVGRRKVNAGDGVAAGGSKVDRDGLGDAGRAGDGDGGRAAIFVDEIIIGGEGEEPVGVIVHNGQDGVAGATQGGGGVGAVDGGVEDAEVNRAVAIHQLVVHERDQKGLG